MKLVRLKTTSNSVSLKNDDLKTSQNFFDKNNLFSVDKETSLSPKKLCESSWKENTQMGLTFSKSKAYCEQIQSVIKFNFREIKFAI
jgi:hypothetical protein